ncbi:hypothetical protein MPH_03203 [Macrophomina phaseolina MS6]|uniref:Uncharacterized protein n=1 Tax=Macrophomina phaseolina (strain MS6) TaxID=1126212 RepID=K2SRL9_MACPH|nr:hypothetical protein MPH_03203 [Macrophomina phaseolina MS6]
MTTKRERGRPRDFVSWKQHWHRRYRGPGWGEEKESHYMPEFGIYDSHHVKLFNTWNDWWRRLGRKGECLKHSAGRECSAMSLTCIAGCACKLKHDSKISPPKLKRKERASIVSNFCLKKKKNTSAT